MEIMLLYRNCFNLRMEKLELYIQHIPTYMHFCVQGIYRSIYVYYIV